MLNDLKALKKMLTIKFELKIYWYINKGQISNTVPNVMKCHSDLYPSKIVSIVFTKLIYNENVFVFILMFEYILKVKILVVQWTLHFIVVSEHK